MKSRVGVRELKNRATQLIREVREKRVEFVVTVDGTPVARLSPFQDETAAQKRDRRRVAIAALAAVADQVGAKWPKGVSASMAVREQRR
jgi:prevent-host-death family protein